MAVVGYERPNTIEEALGCLGRAGAVLVGGGTKVNAARTVEPIVIVDLQGLDLGLIDRIDQQSLRVGATVTLQQLADDGRVPDIVRRAANREQPSTLRAAATVGGCIATADPASELLAAFLVHDAVVSVADRDGVVEIELQQLLAKLPLEKGRIVTAVALETTGIGSVARVGRTRADRAIVAAAARTAADGECRLALTGVAATPVLVTALEALDPPGDYRGSSEYRHALAATLSARALKAVT
jgi:CO/xanthine dehydrogenase FAD-binding subunit